MRVRLFIAAALAVTLLTSAGVNADPPPPVVWRYVYDAQDLLREVQRDGIVLESYQYDAQGHRIRNTSPEGTARYVWDKDQIVFETDDFGNAIAKYEYAGDRLLSIRRQGEGTSFYLFDALGTPVASVGADGGVRERTKLDAWGVVRERTGSSESPFAFTGHQLDEETGLYYAKARFYDPELGRFLTEDPVRGSIVEPQSLHPYLYAYANPTVYVDPDGRCVGSLQKTSFCQAIAKGIAFVLAGNPEVRVEREIKVRERVVQGRREFRAETGREPHPDEVVWSEPGREYTSDWRELDTSGHTVPDRAEWTVFGAGVGTRVAVTTARAAGATVAEQVVAAATQIGDEAIGEITGVSPGDVADLGRFASRGLSRRSPSGSSGGPEVDVIVEGGGLGNGRVSASEGPTPGTRAPAPTVAEGQIASAYPQGRRVAGSREGRRASDPVPGFRESGAFDWTAENTARMERGQAPIGLDGRPVELHHRNQDPRGPLDEMSATTHQGIEHPNRPSQIDRDRFAGERRRYWVERAREAHGQGQSQARPEPPQQDDNP